MADEYLKEMEELYKKTLQQNSGQRGTTVIVCPHTYDTRDKKNACVLCDLCRDVLVNRETPRTDPKKEKARGINAKKKYYSNVILMSNPSEVVVLEYGDKIFNQLIAGQMDELSEWKNFMHPGQGRNLYVTKIKMGPEKKEVDYKVEPRMSTSAIPDPSVLTRLYDIGNIVSLLETGTVKPITQSKFDFQKTEVRFLPSGDKTKPLLFYKLVLFHYGLTKEEFDAVQAGKYNPITGLYTVQGSPIPATGSGTASTSFPPNVGIKSVTPEDLMKDWGMEASNAPIIPEDSDDPFEVETGVEPICFGQYDKDNKTCLTTCTKEGWSEACRKVYDEKLALRSRARRLSK